MALRRIDSALESALGSVMPGPSVGEEGEEVRVLGTCWWQTHLGTGDVKSVGGSLTDQPPCLHESLSLRPLHFSKAAAASFACRRCVCWSLRSGRSWTVRTRTSEDRGSAMNGGEP